MDRKEFLEKFSDVLQTEEAINFDTNLEDLAEWDSLSMMSTMAFLNQEFSVKTTVTEVKTFKTVEDVAKKAGI